MPLTFKASFKRRRCIIPVNGFYEWMAAGPKTKQPFYIHPSDPDQDFAFAGLWDYWETQDGAMESCTIITTEPNALMAETSPALCRTASLLRYNCIQAEVSMNMKVQVPGVLAAAAFLALGALKVAFANTTLHPYR